jgi:hypothetical protein
VIAQCLTSLTILFAQMLNDIRMEGFVCICGSQAINEDPQSVAALNHAVVCSFDSMHRMVPIIQAVVNANKKPAIVMDECHQLLQDKTLIACSIFFNVAHT